MRRWRFLVLLPCLLAPALSTAGDRALEPADLYRMRTIHDPVISRGGRWVAAELRPGRGDGEVVLRAVDGSAEHRVERGARPVFSADGRWIATAVEAPFAERDAPAAPGSKPEKPKPGAALVATADGAAVGWERVERFAFSADGLWLGLHLSPADEQPAAGEESAPEPTDADAESDDEPGLRRGSTLILRELASGRETEVARVTGFTFAEHGPWVAWSTVASDDGPGTIAVRDLSTADGRTTELAGAPGLRTGTMVWAKERDVLAFSGATVAGDDAPGPARVTVWRPGTRPARVVADTTTFGAGWVIPLDAPLTFSRDGERLFVGLRPAPAEKAANPTDAEHPADPLDLEALRARAEVDVWHWRDDRIASERRARRKQDAERTWNAVVHLGTGRAVRLADRGLGEVQPVDNPRAALGLAEQPYLRERTWSDDAWDAWHIELADGRRRLVAGRLAEKPLLSPGGRWVAFWKDGNWQLWDGDSGTTRNLTAALPVPFADQDHDSPSPAPGYGVGGWVEGDAAVLLYDKYDLWQFPTAGGTPVCLTGGRGRAEGRIHRIVDLDPEREAIGAAEPLLLSVYDDHAKTWGAAQVRVGVGGLTPLVHEDAKLTVLAKAKNADRLLMTRERYEVFPDLWVADLRLGQRQRITAANPEIADFAWGSAELVEWRSATGAPLQGVLIRPENVPEGARVPVLVYFYRFMSQRLHEFNEPLVNHRPSFPLYASHGYAVFLPDVRFEVGRPGASAVDCLVPGVQKLIEMGVADPQGIGLHGHSWGGYQTAFVVTQTDVFAAAVAGAPVSNMTSAYSGIRWETGLARQFQYERSQSRIGADLFSRRDLYVASSPVFFVDRLATPLLIMHGDDDGAVPWEQSIELELACRRLGKPCVLLQYRGEPHHPEKDANRLDYTIRMKEFFDHHLRGLPAPEWWRSGVSEAGS